MRLATVAAGVAILLPAFPLSAQNPARGPWERIEPALRLLDGAVPLTGGVRISLPAVTQDGSSVPLTVEVDSPMTPEDFIEEMHLFASGNPSPELVEFRFTPLAGTVHLQTRVRLDGSQTVIALARTSRGQWLAGAREIRVTVSGCLAGGGNVGASDFMRVRARAPDRVRPGVPVEVRTLINHPMETGLRKDESGMTIPERIIREFRAQLEGEDLLTARFHRAVAANPYLLFHVAPDRPGELHLRWEEDGGQSAHSTVTIPSA